jgi:hypothetical protein
LNREDRENYHKHLFQLVQDGDKARKEYSITGGRLPGNTQAAQEYYEGLLYKGQSCLYWLNLKKDSDFNDVLERAQRAFVGQMNLGEGIALNEALRENLFMLLVSVMNQIPILVFYGTKSAR